MKPLVATCPAKVNLCLSVLGKRSDGYHEIESLMVPIDTCDELEVYLEEGEGIELRCEGHALLSGPENLAYKAASLFMHRAGLRAKVRINLKKRIPLGAGLGGGSSDAAGILLVLNSFFENKVPQEELLEWAGELGSDVPFFLMRSPCIARGRGEILEPVSLGMPIHMALWYPGWEVSTKWVYANVRLGLTRGRKQITIPKLIEHLDRVLEILYNDLETVTASEHSWVLSAKERLLEAGAKGALMSGSGPTVFGIFASEEEAKQAISSIQAAPGQTLWYSKGGLWPESLDHTP